MSVRPVADLRCECEFERGPPEFFLVYGVANNCISGMSPSRLCSGLPSMRGGSLNTFDTKFSDF